MLNEMNEKRRSVILHLLERLEGNRVGKKSIQKLVYFLQQELGVDLNYRYKMYHYGPYGSELSNDLDIMDMMGTINIEDDPDGYGYSISPGESNKPNADVEQFLRSHQNSFDKLLRVFGKCSAKRLELYATIHLVERILKGRGPDSSKNSVVNQVKILKPQYPTNEIEEAYQYLLDNSLIALSDASLVSSSADVE